MGDGTADPDKDEVTESEPLRQKKFKGRNARKKTSQSEDLDDEEGNPLFFF